MGDNGPVSSDEIALFLRSRRVRLRPEDVGLRGGTRRHPGLRREDVAALAAMSPDYYKRLEQARVGPPSAQILDSLARVLRLTADEQDYLYRVADREAPLRPAPSREVAPELRQLLNQLGDAPAQIMTMLGDTLVQNRTAVELLGDYSAFTGDHRNSTFRWFMDPAARLMHPPEEHDEESRSRVAELRARWVNVGDPGADHLIGRLRPRVPSSSGSGWSSGWRSAGPAPRPCVTRRSARSTSTPRSCTPRASASCSSCSPRRPAAPRSPG